MTALARGPIGLHPTKGNVAPTLRPGWAQRRPGLHVDSPGSVLMRTDSALGPSSEGRGQARPYSGHHWGLGCCHYVGPGAKGHVQPGSDEHEGYFVLQGGIFLASSLPNSCRVWDCAVAQEAVGRSDNHRIRQDDALGWVMWSTCGRPCLEPGWTWSLVDSTGSLTGQD